MTIRSARAIAYKRGPASVNSSLNEHRAGSGPTHEYKDQGFGRVEAAPIPAKYDETVRRNHSGASHHHTAYHITTQRAEWLVHWV
jgi:hypothetical protein